MFLNGPIFTILGHGNFVGPYNASGNMPEVLPPADSTGAAAATAAACAGELLHNGICLPERWPPRRNFSAGAQKGLIEPPRPSYLTAPPAVRDVSVGRSLFVDEFLLDESLSRVANCMLSMIWFFSEKQSI